MALSFKPVVVTLAAVQLIGIGVGAGPAAADSPASWSVRTVSNQYGAGRSLFGYTLNAGDSLTDGIDITNTGGEPITLKVYGADGFTTAAGGFDTLPSGKPSRDLGTWVKPEVSSLTIAAGDRAQVPFSVTVPANATPGDHMGGIVTELGQHHVGLSIKVRVSGKVAPQLRIEKVDVDYDGSNPFGTGAATVAYTVHNTGNTVLSGIPRVTVAGAFGVSSTTIDGKRLPQLLPGERWNGQVRVDRARAMVWVSGDLTVTPFVTDAAGSTATIPPVRASDRSFVSIWSFVVLLGLAALIVVLALLVIRPLRHRRDARAEADTHQLAHQDR